MIKLDFLSKNLQKWYHKNKRDLPWRETKNPYKIWLSEIILQQTQVKQGLPYYEKFISKYPNVSELAMAPEDQIMRDWQGLGYYSRARNLHSTAKLINNELNGSFPDSYEGLLKLKGIGSYTASAISSFAYKEKKAVVDGNVIRVISRLFGIKKPVNTSETNKEIQKLADQFIDPQNPDIHNQAIMELGALVCTPQNPDCDSCPMVRHCISYQNSDQDKIPSKIKKLKVRNRYFVYLVLKINGALLMKKRTQKDIWNNLFDFPLIEIDHKAKNEEIPNIPELKDFMKDGWNPHLMTTWQKHQLSHQSIWAKFIILRSETNGTTLKSPIFESSDLYTLEQIGDLGKPILIVNFLNHYF